MCKRYLLDCTLRDGGYLNDWAFGKDNITYIFERLVSSGVDVIEVGFLDDRRMFDPDRTIMPRTSCVQQIFGGVKRGGAMVVGMIDFGTCGIENLQPCEESYLDGIRVIFKKDKMVPAIEFCKQVKSLGYKVFAQLVSVTSYSDEELRQVVDLVNACHPYAMSMVDTYGLCDAVKLAHIIEVVDASLDRDIVLGYHAHNNFQLGYANAVSVLNSGLDRDVLVDGTLYGMGKSAGNAPLELLAMYMNLNYGKQYDLGQIQETISTCILDLYRKKPWGYTLFYYIAALNRCHPDYVSFLMNKRTLSVSSVNEILQQIPEEKKLGKDMKMIEALYLEYQKQSCEDAEVLAQLRQMLDGKNVLMVGPGRSVQAEESLIQAYIDREHSVVIPVNQIPEAFPATIIFLTNSRRYLQMSNKLHSAENREIPIIATSNVRLTDAENVKYVNYASLIDESSEFPDNSMMMLVRLLCKVGVKQVALAGFDGYTADNVNFYDANMEYSFIKEKADSLNESGRAFFDSVKDQIKVFFVTTSNYIGGKQ